MHLELLRSNQFHLVFCWNTIVTEISLFKCECYMIFVGGWLKKWVFMIIERIKICMKSTTLGTLISSNQGILQCRQHLLCATNVVFLNMDESNCEPMHTQLMKWGKVLKWLVGEGLGEKLDRISKTPCQARISLISARSHSSTRYYLEARQLTPHCFAQAPQWKDEGTDDRIKILSIYLGLSSAYCICLF